MGGHHEARRIGDTENYKPTAAPQALRLVRGSAEGKEEANKMNETVSPIRNVVQNVFIHVTDVRRAAEWYSMVMGLPLLEERLNGGPIYWFKLACGTNVVLDNHANEPDEPRALLGYPTDDIEAAYDYMVRRDVPLLTAIKRPNPGLAHFSIADPDGNVLMAIQTDFADVAPERLPDTASPIMNRFGGIFVHVSDMERAARFHNGVLGLPHTAPDNTIYELRMTRGPGVLLDGNHLGNGDPDRAMFMLDTRDVEAAKAYMAANGVRPFTDIERHGPIAFFTVLDPDGNQVTFCQDDTAG